MTRAAEAVVQALPFLGGTAGPAARFAGGTALAATAACLVAALVTDLRSRRILNAVTLPCLGIVLACQLASGGAAGLGLALLGLLICAGPFFLASLRGLFGMGDVKLLAVVGALLGPRGGAAAVVWVALAGGVQALLAIGAARLRGAPGPRHVPYACAIGAGSVLAVLLGFPG